MNKYTIFLALLLSITGCSNQKFVTIGKERYPINSNGEAVIPKDKLANIERNGNGVHVEHVGANNSLILTEEEYDALSKNPEVFFSELDGQKDPVAETLTAFVKKGSLKENLIRISTEYGLKEFEYVGYDYHISKSSPISQPDLTKLFSVVIGDFPVDFIIDSAAKRVVFIPKS